MKEGKPGIVIVKDGPYLVTGGVPLNEKIIACDGNIHYYEPGRPLPQADEYALCRCGASADKPFCDGAHFDACFDGTETASKKSYDERAELLEGPALDLLDDDRCAFARFCHRHGRDVWELTEESDRPGKRSGPPWNVRPAAWCRCARTANLTRNRSMSRPSTSCRTLNGGSGAVCSSRGTSPSGPKTGNFTRSAIEWCFAGVENRRKSLSAKLHT